MAFTLTKGYPLHPQVEIESVIKRVWMEMDCEVEVKGKKKKSDLVMIEYGTEHGKITQRYFPVMEEDTDLGEVVKAINGGIIPDQINDPETFFVGKEIGIEVKHNKSSRTGRTFANVVSVYSLDVEDDDQEEYAMDDFDDDEMTDEDPDDTDSDESEDEKELNLDEDMDEASDDMTDEDLDLGEGFDEDDLPKKPKPRRTSTWSNSSYDEQPDDFED